MTTRIRSIKPELSRHRGLYELEQESGLPMRFAWAMLPTVCCREGRFRWRPWDLKLDILPYDDLDFSRVLDAWLTRGYLVKYRVGDEWFGCIPTFLKHQTPNNRESASPLPPPDQADEILDYRNQPLTDLDAQAIPRVPDACPTREPREDHASSGELELELELEGKDISSGSGPDGVSGGVNPWAQEIEVLGFLNEHAGRRFEPFDADGKPTKSLQIIRGALKQITPLEARRIVILKTREWGTNPDMRKHINPITLYGRKANLEKYLAEVREAFDQRRAS